MPGGSLGRGSREALPIVTRPAAASWTPTSPPPCASLKRTLPGLSLTYFLARRATSGAEPVAPLMVIVLAAEAAAGAGPGRTPGAGAAAPRGGAGGVLSGRHFPGWLVGLWATSVPPNSGGG